MINVKTSRVVLERNEIEKVGWTRTDENFAGGLKRQYMHGTEKTTRYWNSECHSAIVDIESR